MLLQVVDRQTMRRFERFCQSEREMNQATFGRQGLARAGHHVRRTSTIDLRRSSQGTLQRRVGPDHSIDRCVESMKITLGQRLPRLLLKPACAFSMATLRVHGARYARQSRLTAQGTQASDPNCGLLVSEIMKLAYPIPDRRQRQLAPLN